MIEFIWTLYPSHFKNQDPFPMTVKFKNLEFKNKQRSKNFTEVHG